MIKKIPKEKEQISLQLSDEQEQALEKLRLQKGFRTVLLHGVTGSGKSEVFLRYAAELVQQGKQVLFLVPEIALTPQMQHAVEARFGNQIAIYHSHLKSLFPKQPF